MEAYFIFDKNTKELVGNSLGYKTLEQAVNDIYEMFCGKYRYFLTTPSDIENSNLLYYNKINEGPIKYKFNESKWVKLVGEPFVKENFDILKRNFKIEFI